MAVRTFIEAIREGLRDEMRRDPAVIVLGEDVGKKGGVFFATDGLWAEFSDDRVIDTPLTESMIAGVSIGAAANGLRPVAEIQFADFIFPAKILKVKGDMKTDILGTGPFKFVSDVRGIEFRAKKNPDYFVKGRPYLDGVTYYFCTPGCKVRFEQGGAPGPMGEVRVELKRR